MVVKVDFTGKTKSEYLCDRCKTELQQGKNKRYRIVVYDTAPYKSIKTADLCR